MLIVIGLMLTGMLIGYLLKNYKMAGIGKVITVLIWVLLFILGIDVGSNEQIISGLPTIGLDALIITIGAVLGSVVGARLLWTWINKEMKGDIKS